MSEKLCDLFGRLVCVSVCMHVCLCALLLLLLLFIHPRCAFYYGKIVVFIILLVRTRVELAWSEARLRPGEVAGCCKHNCNAYPWASRRIDVYTYIYMAWVYIFMRILYVHLLFYSVCSRFVQQSVDTINYQLYFHFIFLSLISAPAFEPISPPPLPLPCDSWSTGRRPQSASN